MYQSSYLGIVPMATGLFYHGGIHQWWYTPLSGIDVWPAIDPETQELAAEPSLITGASWMGPIKVPDRTLGFTETQQNAKAGPYYDWKIFGTHPGDDRANSSSLGNHARDEFIVVAETRAGSYFKVFGHPERGLKFDHESFSGEGSIATAASKFQFTGKSPFRAFTLETFSASPAIGPGVGPGGSTSSTMTGNDVEVITFTSVPSVTVNWTAARQARFGQFPEIEVWIDDGGLLFKANTVDIRVDAAPPSTTAFTIYPGGTASGFIILK